MRTCIGVDPAGKDLYTPEGSVATRPLLSHAEHTSLDRDEFSDPMRKLAEAKKGSKDTYMT
jgi:hypothetical protein